MPSLLISVLSGLRFTVRPLWGTVFLLIVLCGALSCSSSSPKGPKNLIKAAPIGEEALLEKAMDSYDRGLYTLAAESWTDLRENFPDSYFGVLADLKLGDAQFHAGDYAAAILTYQEFARIHPGHEAMPYLRYQIANSNLEQYRGPDRDQTPLRHARDLFEEVVRQYPRSIYSIFARRRIHEARERLAEHEARVAEFYSRKGVDTASRSRLALLQERYPESDAAQRSLEIPQPAHRQTSTATGLPPSTPVIVFSPPEVQQVVSVREHVTEVLPLSEERPRPRAMALHCDERDGMLVVTIHPGTPISHVVRETAGDTVVWTFRRTGSGTIAREQTEGECRGKAGSVRVADGEKLLARVQTESGTRLTHFVLDRPWRVVFVISGQPEAALQ